MTADMSVDLTGLSKPVNTVAKGVVDGLGAFLSRICLPASEELGLALRDKVKIWRNRNFIEIAQKGEAKLKERKDLKDPKLHPRILNAVYEQGSWVDSEHLKDMWAGLLSASCQDGAPNDCNMIYVDILSKLSHVEALLFNYFCRNTHWSLSESDGLVHSNLVFPNISDLKRESLLNSYDEIDEALTHLNSLRLIERESVPGADKYDKPLDTEWFDSVEIRVTSLGMRLYLRVLGKCGKASLHLSLLNKFSL